MIYVCKIWVKVGMDWSFIWFVFISVCLLKVDIEYMYFVCMYVYKIGISCFCCKFYNDDFFFVYDMF